MAHLIIIAGPQSSGKTTALNFLKNKFKKYTFINEINPYVVAGSNHPKYATTISNTQKQLTKITLSKIKELNKNADYIFETGPLQVVYVEKYSGIGSAKYYFKRYIEILDSFKVTIIFIETLPKISFKRRKNKYLERIIKFGLEKDTKKIMNEYKEKIFSLYPLWHKWLTKFPFQKIIIENNYKTKQKFLEEINLLIKNNVV